MRTVFTLDLPADPNGKFPDDPELTALIRRFGWEIRDVHLRTEADIRAMLVAQGTNTEKASPHNDNPPVPSISASVDGNASENDQEQILHLQAHYRRLARPLFDEMPEVALTELNYVIFLGYVSGDQTLFVITHMVPGEITFRLVHRELPRLQSSTESMIRKILKSKFDHKTPMHITNPSVKVYERDFDHVILMGRVITNAFSETRRTNFKDMLLFVVPLFLFFPAAYVLVKYPLIPGVAPTFWEGTLDRGSTALLTTALVSGLSFLQTWLQIKRTKLIDWTVAVDRQKS